uniref:Integrase zinc-binding domain-containing protein n=1 Tax=Parascaris univalens TaxID=6257 RepID=A0A915AQH8_PARUN
MSKNRVAPIRGITTPRLELMAALIGSRLLNFVKGQLKYTGSTFIWSDSQATLHWIATATTVESPKFAEALHSFDYVDSGNNPADLATRGLTIAELRQCSQCTLNKLKRTTIQVLRATKRMLRSTQIRLKRTLWGTVELEGPATADELDWAELILTIQEQTKISEELERNTDANLYKDEQGIMRCLGRLEQAALPEETVHPIILPKSSALTRLIVLARHKESGRAGVSQTLADVRKRYWIPQGRATVKRILRRHCMTCRRWNAKPFKLPAFPPLPKERTWAMRAFQNVGLDYMGPITVRDLTGPCKRWIALFTCPATRAIHLEVTENLSAEQFLHVLRRFIVRNGYPTSVVLDNAPRSSWTARKLGKVEKLHKNHGGKIKAVDVKMPNGHVLKRPVSMLYPLEVSEEERETLPTTKSKEFVKHLADKNLQAEETEEEEESRAKAKTTRTRYAHALSTVLVIFVTFALTSGAPTNLQFHDLLEHIRVINDPYTQLAFLIMRADAAWYTAKWATQKRNVALTSNDISLMKILVKLRTVLVEYPDQQDNQPKILCWQALRSAEAG